MTEYKPPSFYVEQTLVHEYHIMLKNENMQKARRAIEAAVSGKNKGKPL